MNNRDSWSGSEGESGASPVFERSADDLARQLESDASAEGRALRAEAVGLLLTFKKWPALRPKTDERVAGMQRLFDLNRRVMDHLTRAPGSTR